MLGLLLITRVLLLRFEDHWPVGLLILSLVLLSILLIVAERDEFLGLGVLDNDTIVAC